ncbi:MAG: hypothetical protein WKF77_03395 [Planctomycetaceae bacterium]
MKGPSLRYDVRVLRVFCCDACGRQVQTPGNVTTQTCLCSDPPKFMRPLDRPRTVSPDVSRFISPADPEELIEVEVIDETPYVLHVPVKPPPPARFANRRKLYDETAAQMEPEFGEGIVHNTTNETPGKDEAQAEARRHPDHKKSAEESHIAAADSGRSRRRRRGRGDEPDTARPPGNHAAPPAKRPDVRGRPGTGQLGSTRDAGQPNRNSNAESVGSDQSLPEDRSLHSVDDAESGSVSTDEQASSEQGDGRRRSRRRGRRRGPRPEGGGA